MVALLGVAIASMVLPTRVSTPAGTYTCGRPYERYDDEAVKLRWISDSFILRSKHPNVSFRELPATTCPDSTRSRVVLTTIGAGLLLVGALTVAVAATWRSVDRRRVASSAVHTSTTLPHVAALDGIRGFAVLAVIAFHAGQPWARGGYLGVDVFFVLSGYLITSLLLVEWRRSGSIRLGAFWARRARRLLPALVLVLVGVAAYAVFIAAPENLRELRRDALATLGYVANWRFIFANDAGYFDGFAQPSPLRHMWSLAVEEQFYLVWPVAAFLILRRFRSARALLVVAMVGAVASIVAMALLFHPGHDPSRAYYGTDARVHTILIGAVLAVLLVRRATGGVPTRSRPIELAGIAGALAVVWACISIDGRDAFLYRGGSALLAIATAAVIASVIEPSTRHPLARALSARWLCFVGAISYGLYLWHWPIMLVLTRARTGLTGVSLLGVRVAVTFAVATLSWRFVEMPIRRGALRRSRPGVLTPVAIAMTTAVLFVATVPGRALPNRLFGAEQQVAAVPVGFVKPPGTPSQTLLLGDSVAFTYAAGLEAGRSNYGVEVFTSTVLGCGIARGGPIRGRGMVYQPPGACEHWPERWRDLVDSRTPDVVALAAGRWETYDRQLAGRWTHIGERAFDEYLTGELERAIALLSSRGALVALFTAPYFDGVERPDGGRFPEDDPRRVERFNQLLRDAARRHPEIARVVDVGHVLSPGGRYAKSIRGVEVRTEDGVHVTAAGRQLLAVKVLPQLVALGEPAALR